MTGLNCMDSTKYLHYVINKRSGEGKVDSNNDRHDAQLH